VVLDDVSGIVVVDVSSVGSCAATAGANSAHATAAASVPMMR
jgi:hypothetical protein